VEKAQAAVDQTKAEELVRKLRDDAFTLEDFREQLKQLRSMGPLDQILGMLPFGKMLKGAPTEVDAEQADIGRFDAIIGSMTPNERQRPEVINGSRRQRIARGSGTTVQDVNRLLKQYAQLRKMMRQFKGLEGKLPRMKLPGLPNMRGGRGVGIDSAETDGIHAAPELPRGGGGFGLGARWPVRRC